MGLEQLLLALGLEQRLERQLKQKLKRQLVLELEQHPPTKKLQKLPLHH